MLWQINFPVGKLICHSIKNKVISIYLSIKNKYSLHLFDSDFEPLH